MSQAAYRKKGCDAPAVLTRRIAVLGAVMLASIATVTLGEEPRSMDSDLRHVELEWARVRYQVKDTNAQEREMHALAEEAAEIVERYPRRAEPLIWSGIVISSEAELAGALSAIGLAKRAREMFEEAGLLDYRAIDGAVPTSLGALYYLVPGFPLGFGDNEKARHYLEQGVELSPDGLDSNFFYGDFLYAEGEYEKAKLVLARALRA